MASNHPKDETEKSLAEKPSTSTSTSLVEEGVELASPKTGVDTAAPVAGAAAEVAVKATSEGSAAGDGNGDGHGEGQRYTWRFYTIYASLIAATVLSALDGSIVSTALPTIAETLDLGGNAVWVANVYFLTGLVCLYLYLSVSFSSCQGWNFHKCTRTTIGVEGTWG